MRIDDAVQVELTRRAQAYMRARARRDAMSERAAVTPTLERAAALEAAQLFMNQVAVELAELTCAAVFHEDRT